MLQAILSRVHYNLTHPKTPMAIMPLVEEQFREQGGKRQEAWRMIERLKCPECRKEYSVPTWIATARCRQCDVELVKQNVQMAHAQSQRKGSS